MMDILEAVLQSQPPALPKILAVRSCLQQSLDVYKPLQADLTQRMAQASHLDGEVREALMVQLLGRQDLGSSSPGPACAAAKQEVDILCAPAQLHLAADGSVEACLVSAGTWTFDAFALTQATEGHPLSVLAYWLLHQSGLAAWAQLDQVKLARWLCCIEDGYCANPYHNRSHAADVLQTMHMLLTRGGLVPGYADQQSMLAAYLAAVCHDYQHIGRTNDYLVQTQDELALRYNDRSPMENHHLAAAWSLLRVPQLNFLQALPQPAWDRLRKLVIELVLGTDKAGGVLGLHTIGPSTASSDSPQDPHPVVGSSCNSHSERKVLQPLSEQDKLISLQMALKCSDLGHLAAPLPVHLAWVSRLEAEFFLQGDVERADGLPLSPLCDRTKQGITKSQVGFFDFVALPLFNNFAARFTAAKPLLAGVMRNYRHWQAQAAAAEPERRTPGGPGAARA
ncbi:3'5'-cyclic nucleotide phosphodiesterase [Haematococcus lacustris]|uniref:Phosphodiesterase n=1 Tax=Haematococcus lacustris TaxID=44745 RepID=A0A699ZFM1_HAELA|nr:3'5'-cyclic nucleotide phosphodiesterase [Haematococcus lacustris]